MSAWIVSQAHVDALVSAALPSGGERLNYNHAGSWHEVGHGDADRVGRLLWEECHRSVNYRYTESTPTPAYNYRIPGATLSVATLIKAAHCYRYQSCEHPEWETSEARAIIEALESHLVHRVPGYEEAPWGLDDEHVRPSNAVSIMTMIGRSGR